MRILFISDIAENFSVGGFEPLGIMYVASPLKKAGHEIAITEARAERALPMVKNFQPHIVAYSTTTGLHQLYLDINRKIKKQFDVLSVFGGPHPTFFPEMIEEEGVDAVCRGEGEEVLPELVNALGKGKPVRSIANLWVKENGTIYRNQVRHLVEDLDQLDFPERDFYYSTYPFAAAFKMKTFIASRGCPYRCTYCFNHAFNKLYRGKGKVIRFRSVDNVIREISEVRRRYPLDIVVFHDSSFLFDTDWLKKFCSLFKKLIGVPFNCNARPEHISEERVAALKEGGCFSIVWSVEAANDRIRKEILNRDISKDSMLEASRLLHKYNINFAILNIVGIPGESLKECIETLDFNIRCRPGYASTSLLYPYPGTEIYKIAAKMNLLPEGKIDFNETFYIHTPIKLKKKLQIENLQKLFSITVEFPRLRWIVLRLLNLPLGFFYNIVRRLHKGYCLHYRIFYYNITLREYLALVFRFLTSKAG